MSRDQLPGRIRGVSGGMPVPMPLPPRLPGPSRRRPPPKASILSFENYLLFWAGCSVGGVGAGYWLTGMFFG